MMRVLKNSAANRPDLLIDTEMLERALFRAKGTRERRIVVEMWRHEPYRDPLRAHFADASREEVIELFRKTYIKLFGRRLNRRRKRNLRKKERPGDQDGTVKK